MKGQIRMFETIGVLVIFFFMLGLGASVYSNYRTSSFEKQQRNLADLKAGSASDTAFYLPELDCNFVNVQTPNCFDIYKLNSLSELMKDRSFRDSYFLLFGPAEVKVRQIFPESDYNVVVYNYTTPYSRQIVSRSPVLLYDIANGVKGNYAFGLIEVTTYAP